MINTGALNCSVSYSGAVGLAGWQGRVVSDQSQFIKYLREVVRPRVADTASSFAADLRGLATTGMETEFVERLLNAVPESKSWEIGEAFAECALGDESCCEVHWPWNSVRDRRTPRASLPGADLVGFYRKNDTILLLFGEVKTSSDRNSPPGVMNGGSGMTWQLEQSATRLEIQHSLLKWLYERCGSRPCRDLYEKAVARYLSSEGKDLLLVGVLVRDTDSRESDLEARAKDLVTALPEPTRIELIAWYLPVRIAKWTNLLQEGAP